jgi:anti-sigma factor RsiW
MQCERVQQELLDYLWGRLSPAERSVIEAHLAACRACSEEAAAMNHLGDTLSRGLRAWVDQGECPPEVMARLERAIRPQPRWQPWRLVAGAAAAVALFFLVTAVADLSGERLDSVPVVGNLADRLSGWLGGAGRQELVRVDRGHTVGGVEVRVDYVVREGNATRVRYQVRGEIDSQADIANFQPRLQAGDGEIALKKVAVVSRQAGALVLDATFEPIRTGQRMSLTLEKLPARSGEVLPGPWRVDFGS